MYKSFNTYHFNWHVFTFCSLKKKKIYEPFAAEKEMALNSRIEFALKNDTVLLNT